MRELIQLDTNTLKDAAQRLWRNMCAPTCDGNWIPGNINDAFRKGAASGIDFIIGIPGKEMQEYRSIIGEQNYEDLISTILSDMKNVPDSRIAEEAQKYIDTQPDAADKADMRNSLVEHWLSYCMCRSAESLSEGGNTVHLMFWNQKPLIEKLGSGTVDVATVLLGNDDASLMYGSVINKDLSEVLQTFLRKFMNGEALQLYQNEIKGIDAFDWDTFPRALFVADGAFHCGAMEGNG